VPICVFKFCEGTVPPLLSLSLSLSTPPSFSSNDDVVVDAVGGGCKMGGGMEGMVVVDVVILPVVEEEGLGGITTTVTGRNNADVWKEEDGGCVTVNPKSSICATRTTPINCFSDFHVVDRSISVQSIGADELEKEDEYWYDSCCC